MSSASPSTPGFDGGAAALRQCVLAVSVLHDVDLQPRDEGVLLTDDPQVLVPWEVVATAAGDHDLPGAAAREAVRVVLLLHHLVARLGDGAANVLAGSVRLLALPRDHARHGGPDWQVTRLAGGALDVGLGVVGLVEEDRLDVLPTSVLVAAGLHAGALTVRARAQVERMGELMVERVRRDGRNRRLRVEDAHPAAPVLRPMGGCDVLTLLTSRTLRDYLAGTDPSGLCAVAVPMRTRGWFDLTRTDPAFVTAAWSATEPFDRGLPRPVLVTREEVTLPGGR